jgi:DNA-binding PadR family transcriptional regulator
MGLSHTILTLLSESASTGYELSKRFEDVVSCFWKAHLQQIYRELANMERLEWVTSEVIPQKGKPDKKLYRMTETGRKELEEWLVSPCAPSPIREDLLVKVLAGALMPRAALIQQIQEQRSLHQHQLNSYQEQEQIFAQIRCPEEHLKFRYFTLRRGIRYETDWIEWCDEVLAAIEEDPSTLKIDSPIKTAR